MGRTTPKNRENLWRGERQVIQRNPLRAEQDVAAGNGANRFVHSNTVAAGEGNRASLDGQPGRLSPHKPLFFAGFEGFPVFVGEGAAEGAEFSGTLKEFAAIHADDFAVDVGGAVAH